MTFAKNTFRLDPVRENVLLEPQIRKELFSLESSIASLEKSVAESNQKLTAKLAENAMTAQATLDKLDATLMTSKTVVSSCKSTETATRNALRTSDVYATMGPLPQRFEEPDTWNYKIKKQNPLYTTTTNQYGQQHPTIHDMPTVFRGQTSKFSEHLNISGPYRNFSLNI
ncbi:hypothetical protein BDV3_005420 [Batrachochytrium dendrobatidis]|nr:hypothetical protein QVD99_000648 [Batrachochytrium dendrobatidis]OAJ39640.1 hypothetical protein BDEG_23472 [Batrachochytrium dendrobatidis JEL423]